MANEPVFLETELLELKRLKLWRKIITTAITVLFASILVAYSNFSFKLQEAKAETDPSQTEINKNIATETASLESEKLALERFKVWKEIITVAITVGLGTVLGVLINYSFQKRQLKQQKLIHDAELDLQNAKAETDHRQAEMKYLGDFIKYALEDNYDVRFRFADYFATLTISPELQKKWEKYRDGIIQNQKVLDEKKTELAKAQEEGDEEKVKSLRPEVVRLETQAAPLPEISDVYLSYVKAQKLLLDENFKPKQYTRNNFEKHNDGKVICDKATGLMWQQSGSEKDMGYNQARNYIRQLNLEDFAGHNDWRLPTLKEAITLLKPEKTDNGLFIDPVFDDKQGCIWTSDLSSASSAWVVLFFYGYCTSYPFDHLNYVRAVR